MSNFKLSDRDRATLQFKVTTKLRELILKGEFKMGERLMQEEWAKNLGVSRMPVREALRQLEVEGLVQIEPRRGAVVMPISTDDIEEIFQLRAILEGKAVEQSVTYLVEEDIEELAELYEKMLKLTKNEIDIEEYMLANEKFHKILIGASPWRRIKGFIDTLWKGIASYTPSLLPDHYEEAQKEHYLMLEYAKQRNGKALKKVTEKHILRTRDNLIEMVQSGRNEK